MTKRAMFLAVLVALVLVAGVGCESYATYTPSAHDLTRIPQELPPGPTRDAVQATAVARYVAAEQARQQSENANATAQAYQLQAQAAAMQATEAANAQAQEVARMTAEANSQAAARADAAAATRQALDSQERAIAIQATATAAAFFAEVRATQVAVEATSTTQSAQIQATATTQAQQANGTATTQAGQATATIVAQADAATATAVQATVAAVAREERREAYLEPARAIGTFLLLALAAALLLVVAWRLYNAIEDRMRLVRRGAGEGEPIMLITRERMALPMRAWGSYEDLTHGHERAPMLAPSEEIQESASKRQGLANVIQAGQAGEIARAENTPKRLTHVVTPGRGGTTAHQGRRGNVVGGLQRVHVLDGLDQATKQGVLTPAMAKALEGEWEEV